MTNIRIHEDSRIDNDIPARVRDYVLFAVGYRSQFFVETVTYPEVWNHYSLSDWQNPGAFIGSDNLPPVQCKLHGDMVRVVTIIGGPHPDDPEAGVVVFAMCGGRTPFEEGVQFKFLDW